MAESAFNYNITDSEREDLKISSMDENSYLQSVSTVNKLKDLHRLFYLRED